MFSFETCLFAPSYHLICYVWYRLEISYWHWNRWKLSPWTFVWLFVQLIQTIQIAFQISSQFLNLNHQDVHYILVFLDKFLIICKLRFLPYQSINDCGCQWSWIIFRQMKKAIHLRENRKTLSKPKNNHNRISLEVPQQTEKQELGTQWSTEKLYLTMMNNYADTNRKLKELEDDNENWNFLVTKLIQEIKDKEFCNCHQWTSPTWRINKKEKN